MQSLLQAALCCQSCNPSLIERREPYTPDPAIRCTKCGSVLVSRPFFFGRVKHVSTAVLDPTRQGEIRARIGTEFP